MDGINPIINGLAKEVAVKNYHHGQIHITIIPRKEVIFILLYPPMNPYLHHKSSLNQSKEKKLLQNHCIIPRYLGVINIVTNLSTITTCSLLEKKVTLQLLSRTQ